MPGRLAGTTALFRHTPLGKPMKPRRPHNAPPRHSAEPRRPPEPRRAEGELLYGLHIVEELLHLAPFRVSRVYLQHYPAQKPGEFPVPQRLAGIAAAAQA